MRSPQASHSGAQRRPESANVLGVRVDAVDMEAALQKLRSVLARGAKGYTCAVSVHGVLEARRDCCIAQAFCDAALVVPDGRPMLWVGRWQGYKRMRQVTGPDLMRETMRRPEFAGCSHFFYGGKDGVAEELAARWEKEYSWTRIAGTYTPPFRELTVTEESELIDLLNRLRPDFLWVGISTPRQELFMRRILPRIRRGVLMGVGAAFDFHTGRIRDCAPWVKRAGLQWIHRLMQDPQRLWRRNLHNMSFIWLIVLQLAGLRKYRRDQPASAASVSSLGESA
jgi:N-acetylglucosaminyldiphosphoundecaprenol N-acetyl-beta-D-mannosaminyltransferase